MLKFILSSRLLSRPVNMFRVLMTVILTSALCSCHSIDDKRIPSAPVNLIFNDAGVWNVYGIGGAMQSREFSLENRVPANFPYTASSYTGFGGLLLASDYYGNLVVYDLACPVECRRDVRVQIDHELNVAACPVCHSTYAVFENFGHPLSGLAADRGYGLTKYRIIPTATGGYQVTR